MIAKDVDHESHDLLPHASAVGRFLVSLLVSGLFVPDLALIGGVHAPHKMVLASMESISLIAKPGVSLFREGSG